MPFGERYRPLLEAILTCINPQTTKDSESAASKCTEHK
jgi:hypothetical protein